MNERSEFPRLSISDLLVLTLTVGLAFACVTPQLRDFLNLPPEKLRIPRWQGVLPEVTDYTAIGLSLFGLIVLARERFRGSSFPLSPGHWIFIATGPYLMLRLTGDIVHYVLTTALLGAPRIFRHRDELLFAIVLTLSIVFAAPKLRAQEPRWRVCHVLLLLWLAIAAIWCGLQAADANRRFSFHLLAIGATAYLSAFAAGCVAVGIDVVRKTRRDWLHYFALMMLVLLAVSNVLHYGDLLANWWTRLFSRLFG